MIASYKTFVPEVSRNSLRLKALQLEQKVRKILTRLLNSRDIRSKETCICHSCSEVNLHGKIREFEYDRAKFTSETGFDIHYQCPRVAALRLLVSLLRPWSWALRHAINRKLLEC